MTRREGSRASGFPFLGDVGLVAGECGMTGAARRWPDHATPCVGWR